MTAEDYLAAAGERARDAAVLSAGARHCAAMYMAGYAVECKLKAYLQRQGRKFSTAGSAGHNLRGLWDAAGFRASDVAGHKRLFLDTWTTSLRYQAELPAGADHVALSEGARLLSGYVQVRIRGRR